MRTISLLFIVFFSTEILFAGSSKCAEDHSYLQFDSDKNYTIESLQKMLQKEPDDVECMVKLVDLYLKRGEVSKGFALLAKAYKKDPKFVKSKKISKIVHVALYINKLENDAKTKNDAKSWNLLGLNYYKMGVFKEAVKCYRKSLKIDPSQIDARLNLAVALSRIGQKYMAIEELDKVIQRDKNNFYAYYYSGKILKYQIGDKNRAKKFLNIAKKLCREQKDKFPKKVYGLYMKDLESETK